MNREVKEKLDRMQESLRIMGELMESYFSRAEKDAATNRRCIMENIRALSTRVQQVADKQNEKTSVVLDAKLVEELAQKTGRNPAEYITEMIKGAILDRDRMEKWDWGLWDEGIFGGKTAGEDRGAGAGRRGAGEESRDAERD